MDHLRWIHPFKSKGTKYSEQLGVFVNPLGAKHDCFVSNLTDMNNFHPLEVVCRGSETQLQVAVNHWGKTGLANAGVSLSKMDAPKVGKSVFCPFEVFYHNFRASHSPTVFI